MLYDCFTIYDEKAEAFLPPFILPNSKMAKRVFADCVNSDTHQFGANPHDYTLFRLGQFDDAAGRFLMERDKQSLGNGVEFRSLEKPRSPELGNGSQKHEHEKISNGAPVLTGAAGESPEEQL